MKVLFVHNCPTEFVKIDSELLSRRFVSRELCARLSARQFVTVPAAVAWADVVVCWFASWHAIAPVLFAKLLGKSCVLIVGGYDSANMPEIHYGHQRGGAKKLISSWLIRNASLLVVNSEYSAHEVTANVPHLRCPIRVIYHGIPDSFGNDLAPNIPNRVITVGNVCRSNLLRKGIRWFCEASHLVPEAEFIVAGKHVDESVTYLRSISGSNVRFTGFLSAPDLAALYRSASVYVQPSGHEAFGLSVAESMLAGCIPVVSNRGSLSEVVGDCGVVLKSCDPRTVADGIREAMRATPGQRVAARARILTAFPVDKRGQALGDALLMTAKRQRLPPNV